MRTLRYLTLTLFFLGYAILAVVGTRTKMVFQWPSYLLLGLAAVVSVGFLFSRRMKAAPGAWCLGSMLLLSGYVVVRAAASPVEYFARMDIAMVLAAVIVYLLFSIHFARSRYRALFIGLLLLLALGNMFVGLYQILRDPTYMVLPGYSRLAQPGARRIPAGGECFRGGAGAVRQDGSEDARADDLLCPGLFWRDREHR